MSRVSAAARPRKPAPTPDARPSAPTPAVSFSGVHEHLAQLRAAIDDLWIVAADSTSDPHERRFTLAANRAEVHKHGFEAMCAMRNLQDELDRVAGKVARAR